MWWGVAGVRLLGLVMAQTQPKPQCLRSPRRAGGGGRKEGLPVWESWESGWWAGPGAVGETRRLGAQVNKVGGGRLRESGIGKEKGKLGTLQGGGDG